MKKDNRIELYRFIFAVIIMIYHAHNVNNDLGHPIPLGHVFVEFFFFLTGYFTYAHVNRKRLAKDFCIEVNAYPFVYTWNKLKRMIPYIVITAGIYYLAVALQQILIRHMSIEKVFKGFSGAPFDLLLFQITGICKNPHFNSWWYLSALLFALPIVVGIFCKNNRFSWWAIHLLPLIIYGYFALEVDGLNWETLMGITRSGFFRGYAGLCMGGTIYCLAQKVSEINFSLCKKGVLTIIEITCYLLAVLIAWKYYEITNSTFIIVFLLICGLVISFSNQSFTTYLDLAIWGKLGAIATPLYICHYSVGRLVGLYIGYFTDNLFWRYFVYYTSSVMMALCIYWINNQIEKRKNYGAAR